MHNISAYHYWSINHRERETSLYNIIINTPPRFELAFLCTHWLTHYKCTTSIMQHIICVSYIQQSLLLSKWKVPRMYICVCIDACMSCSDMFVTLYRHNQPHLIIIIIITIIIIIKRGRQCKAAREWYTPYQFDDPSPTIPTYRNEEEKIKIVEEYRRDRAA